MLSITHFWLWNNEKYLEARSLSFVPSKLKEGIKTLILFVILEMLILYI